MAIHMLPGIGVDCNVYVIDGHDPVLIDAGMGDNTPRLLAAIARILPNGGPKRVVLTHSHYDHTGGAAEVARALGAELFVHPDDAEGLRQGDSWKTMSIMFGVDGTALEVTDLVEGSVVDTGNHRFEVLHTPGHTPGSICLFEESSGALISGDTVFADGVGRWDLPGGNLDALKDSILRLSRLNIKDVYPGHGPIAKGSAKRALQSAARYVGES
ncbi:MAG TPA: MBL fold metallo-hydrolase [Methanomassiliicoccales archaeon]|nr:MBL fold metallo-hydrolase [Methanomassiliicoccales archaeon]